MKYILIFDCDGVIFDSNRLKTEAFRRVLFENGYDKDVVDQFIEHHTKNGGVSRYVKFNRLFSNILNVSVDYRKLEILLSEFSAICLDLYCKVRFTPNCIETLDFLSKNHDLHVASGGDQDELKTVFKQRKISNFFDEILGSPMSKIDCVKAIVSKYSSNNDKFIMVGDSRADFHAAQSSKIQFVYMESYSEDKNSMKKLALEEKFVTISHLGELKLSNILSSH